MSRPARAYARTLRAFLLAVCPLLLSCSTSGTSTGESTKHVVDDRPTWSATGVAQVEFEGDRMFVERIGRQWHAWVVSDTRTWQPAWNVETTAPRTGAVLDFFRGERTLVYPGSTADGISYDEFTTMDGELHQPTVRHGVVAAAFKSSTGTRLGDLEFGNGIKSPPRKTSSCPIRLQDVRKQRKDASTSVWRKVVLYRDPPTTDCPQGSWNSFLFTAMDLGDGTLLATTPRYVLRLRFSDLRPVGSVANLHVVDAAYLERLLAESNVKDDNDVHRLLNRVLQLAERDVSAKVGGL